MINNRVIFLFLILNLATTSTLSWGDKGHRLINRHAMNNLHPDMTDFKILNDTISALASAPDKRRKYDPTEYTKHFIDIDFYEEFLSYKMERNLNRLKEKYSDSIVTKMGILPWNTIDCYKELVTVLHERKKDLTIKLMADIGHYVADAHNPMHTVLNYDGILSNQKGLHSRYESKMFNFFYEEIENALKVVNPTEISNIETYVWDYITASHYNHHLIFLGDLEGVKMDSSYGEKYYEVFWLRTKFLTFQSLNNAVEAIASIFYTAWIEAGKPAFNEFY
jgi:hypothetical protein